MLLDEFDGVPSSSGPNQYNNEEVALDIEMVISVATNLSGVVVDEAGPAGNALDILSAMSTNKTIKQFSCSWDFGTTTRGTMDTLFQKMSSQGQSFFNASGDDRRLYRLVAGAGRRSLHHPGGRDSPGDLRSVRRLAVRNGLECRGRHQRHQWRL